MLELEWSVERQAFSVDGEAFEHEGPVDTDVAHDLCHLVVAANGRLPWRPSGADREIRLAEFNAVFLENMYATVYESLAARAPVTGFVDRAATHARWFVEEYYAPFPVTFEEARRTFLVAIRPEVVARFFPAYVNAYLMTERARASPFPRAVIRLHPDERPPWQGGGREEIASALEAAKRRASPIASSLSAHDRLRRQTVRPLS